MRCTRPCSYRAQWTAIVLVATLAACVSPPTNRTTQTTQTTPTTQPVSFDLHAKNIRMGANGQVCAVGQDGSLSCWAGTGTSVDAPQAVHLGTGRTVKSVGIGVSHTCALLDDGSVKCWGGNNLGQLGLGDTTNRSIQPSDTGDQLPAVALPRAATFLAVGGSHTCALLSDGALWCWGDNSFGQLGLARNGSAPAAPVLQPTAVDNQVLMTTSFQFLTAGTEHTCGVDATGHLLCWGDNTFGELGSTNSFDSGPRLITMGGTPVVVREAAAGENYTCVILTSGQVACWGDNFNGQLGDGTNQQQVSPVPVKLDPAVAPAGIAVDGGLSCVVNGGQPQCWGISQLTRCYITIGANTPRAVASPSAPVTQVASGMTGTWTCMLSNDGKVTCYDDMELFKFDQAKVLANCDTHP